MNRRRYLAAVGAAALAGCSDDTGEGGGDPETESDQTGSADGTDDGSGTPRLEVVDLEAPERLAIDTPVPVRVVVRNTGDRAGETELDVTAGDRQRSESVAADSGETTTVEMEFDAFAAARTVTVEATGSDGTDPRTADLEIVEPELSIRYDLESTQVVGEDERVSITVENQTAVDIETDISFELGAISRTESVGLDANGQETVEFSYTVPDGRGTTTAEITGSIDGTVRTADIELIGFSDMLRVSTRGEPIRYDCNSSYNYASEFTWELEVTTVDDVDFTDREELEVGLAFFDGRGRYLGGATVSGPAPRSDSTAIWELGATDFVDKERHGYPACTYVDRILDAVDGNGSIVVTDEPGTTETVELSTPTDAIRVTDSFDPVRHDCNDSYNYVGEFTWELEVTGTDETSHTDRPATEAEVEFFDGRGRYLGGAIVNGPLPRAGETTIWEISETDFHNEERHGNVACTHVDRILDAADGDGSIDVTDDRRAEERITLSEPADVVRVTTSRDPVRYDCNDSYNYVSEFTWAITVTTVGDTDYTRRPETELELAFVDREGTYLGGATVRGPLPKPGETTVWEIGLTDFHDEERHGNPACTYVDRILEAMNDGGSLTVA
ncbi:hypothetical protein [Natrinema thermotolerans]|nr:hypothetical protein [Natrinema thermotolerans]